MLEIKHAYVDSLAANASAIKNGKALVSKNKFQKLSISPDKTVLFGECSGSGSKPYICSMDFIDKSAPVGRCSCPSRQFPCKHVLGLLYAYADNMTFTEEEIPEDLISKREKQEKKAENKEKKKEAAKEQAKDASKKKAPTKAQLNATTKKIKAQLEGIAIAQKLLHNILQMGIASIDATAIKTIQDQVKQLGNYYIEGIQNGFSLLLIHIKANKTDDYNDSIQSLLFLSALLKKANTYLTEKLEDPEKTMQLDIESEIEEQIGHIWKLDELMMNQKYMEHASLTQLSFYSYDDVSRQAWVDEGYFLCLNNQELYKSVSYRPYKAAKHIKEGDSMMGVLEIPDLYIYPGGLNKRVRWDAYELKEYKKEHYQVILASAKDNYKEVVKSVKNQIKNPLSDKHVLALLKINRVLFSKTTGTDTKHVLEIEDKYGTRQIITDDGFIIPKTLPLFRNLHPDLLSNTALLVMFHNDFDTGLLSAKALSIITEDEIVRLLY